MRLTRLKEYRRLFYAPSSAPSMATLRAQINEIPGGRKIKGRYWVDLDVLEGKHDLLKEVTARKESLDKSPELAGLL